MVKGAAVYADTRVVRIGERRTASVHEIIRRNRISLIETIVVGLGTLAVMIAAVQWQFVRTVDALFVARFPGHDLVDLGPGLLFFACGLGTMVVRRWVEADREKQRLERTRSVLQESEERYRSLVEVSPDPVIVAVDGVFTYVNPAAVSFFGAQAPADLIGHRVLDRVPVDVRSDAAGWLGGVISTGEDVAPTEGRLLRLDGSAVQAEIAVVSTSFEGRDAVQAVVRDTSARHAADEALTRYQALAENSQEIVFFTSPDGRIVDTNRAALLKYGYTKQEFASMTTRDLRAPGWDGPTAGQLTHKPGDTVRFDVMHALKDGTTIELSVTAQRVMIGDDEFVVSLCRDVTDKRKTLRDLQASEAHYRSLIELTPSPIGVYRDDGTIVFANQATLDLLRARDASEVVGQDMQTFVHPNSAQVVREAREELERDGVAPFRDIRIVRLDGTSVAAQMAGSRTTYDGAAAFQVVIQDVSRLLDVAETLKRTTADTISAMARLAETRDPYTSGHQERVAAMAERIALRLGLPEATCEAIKLAGTVHDIGKMTVPAEILSKPGRLTAIELEIIKCHVERGYEVLLPIDFPWPIADIVRQHHERIDGSGYPRGLRGDEIRIEARVIAVADTVEAVSSDRPYRPALGTEYALSVITQGRGTLFDAECVDACLQLAAESALFDDTVDPRVQAA
jgi:PAS domain S-box-containing protein/putative nucleotidyltransferase with HDIG domain